jgi:hypothetical protein
MAYDSSLLQDKIRTPEDLALYSAKVLSSITLETGVVESQEKFKNLQEQSLSADNISKKVSVFQRLASLAKKRGATQTKSAISNGAAYEFHCSIEDPSSPYCVSSVSKQEFVELIESPRFLNSPFLIAVPLLAAGITYYTKGR